MRVKILGELLLKNSPPFTGGIDSSERQMRPRHCGAAAIDGYRLFDSSPDRQENDVVQIENTTLLKEICVDELVS